MFTRQTVKHLCQMMARYRVFKKFLFLSSVIKFDNEMSEVKTKITIAQLLFMQSQNLLSKTRTTLLSPGNSIILEIAATLLFICVTSFH